LIHFAWTRCATKNYDTKKGKVMEPVAVDCLTAGISELYKISGKGASQFPTDIL
jgi:hypothetical protein